MLDKLKKINLKGIQYKLLKRTFKLIFSVVPGWTLVWAGLLIFQGFMPGIIIYLTKLTIESFVIAVNDFSYLSKSITLLMMTGGGLLISELLQFAMNWVRSLQSDILNEHLKNLIHEKAAQVDIEFYESSAYFDLLEQAKGSSVGKPLALLEGMGSVLQSIITLLTFITILVSYGWWLPIILIAASLPAFFIYLRSERKMYEWQKRTAPDRRRQAYYDLLLTNSYPAAEMRIFNLTEHFRARYQILSNRLRQEKMQHIKRQFVGKFIASILGLLTAALCIGWIALGVLNKVATFGDLAVFYQVFSRGQSLMQSLLGGINNTFSSSLYLQNLFEFLDLQPKIVSPTDVVAFPDKIRHGINFSDISFRYPGESRLAISNFNLFIPAGKVVAIVGVNGAGKSTLIKLLCRFYDPSAGKIEIDGIDIKCFDIDDLRRNLSVYFQFPVQYYDTAAQNIAFGDIKILPEKDELQKAAKLAGAHEFIDKLPEQYESVLGKYFADGHELSGGEWQRLTLAKSYYRKSPILILDEPTSFMDSWSEGEWFNHLRSLLTNRTGLIITHRFTIAARADIIHVVRDGNIIESGSHEQLLEAKGFYAESWDSQMQSSDKPLLKNGVYV